MDEGSERGEELVVAVGSRIPGQLYHEFTRYVPNAHVDVEGSIVRLV